MGTGWRGGESEGGLLRDIALVRPGRTHTRYETVLSFVMYVLSAFTATKMIHHYLLLHFTCDVKSMQSACRRVLKLFDGDYSDPLHIAKHLLCWCDLLV